MNIDGLVIDSFAGGGGASTGIEMALGRSPDIAINHDAEALALHAANHPNTRHYSKNIWQVDPLEAVGNTPVALAWFSPDCKHFSKAKGGKPVKKHIRDLAWVVVRWARQVRPAVIMLENVEEFQTWGPLIHNAAGELIPDPERKGQTFRAWTAELRRLGYRIEWRELRACDYGAPTIRKRFFMIARRDGRKIAWPKPTHGDPKLAAVLSGLLQPWRTAASIIDWSLPCHSIFLTKEQGRALGVKRPLEEATMARIAKGVKRYVIDAVKPFIVNLTHQGSERTESVDAPLNTVTGAHRGEKAVVMPHFSHAQHGGSVRDPEDPLATVTASSKDQNQVVAPIFVGVGGRAGQSPPRSGDRPTGTSTAKADVGLVIPTLIQTGYGERAGQEPRVPGLDKPLGTAVAGGVKHALVAAHLTKFRANSVGSGGDEPVPTITANSFIKRPGGAPPIGVVEAFLTKFSENSVGTSPDEPLHTAMAGAPRHGVVAAFMAQHNIDGRTGEGNAGRPLDVPVSTVTSTGAQQGVIAGHMIDMHGSDMRQAGLDEPLRSLTAQGYHAAQVAAFLTKYHGLGGQHADPNDPMRTVDTRDRFGLITVEIEGEPYIIADIGMRMLTPRELFRAQGFPETYIIDPVHNGKKLTKTAQIRMCGNSVCPQVAEALVRANLVEDVGHYVHREREAPMEFPLWPEDAAA